LCITKFLVRRILKLSFTLLINFYRLQAEGCDSSQIESIHLFFGELIESPEITRGVNLLHDARECILELV